MKNKKKRLFKILFFPISLMLCLSIFIISSFAASGWEVEENGDILSLNLFNIDEAVPVGSATINNGVVSGNDTRTTFDVVLQAFNNGSYVRTLSSRSGYVGTISLGFNKTSDFNQIQFGHNGATNDVKVLYNVSALTNNTTYTLSFYILSVSNPHSFDDIMLNEGSTRLDYFPYGSYSTTSANPFSSNNIRLIDFLGYGVAGNWTELPKDNAYKYFSIQSFQVERFLSDNNIIQSNTAVGRCGIEIDLINPIDISNYHYFFNFFNDSYNGTPPDDYYIGFSRYQSTDNFIVYYTNQESTQYQSSFTIDLPSNFICDGISVFWYNTDTNRNILQNITLGSYDLGYNNGVKSGRHLGYQSGFDDGVVSGQASGYQNGYNAGVNTNLETNGMRTLFNSILSFPVDMIKSVFNFEFMGVNIASVITFIISIGIVAFVLKKFL